MPDDTEPASKKQRLATQQGFKDLTQANINALFAGKKMQPGPKQPAKPAPSMRDFTQHNIDKMFGAALAPAQASGAPMISVPAQAPAEQPAAQGTMSENHTLAQETPVAPSSANMAPEALTINTTMPNIPTEPSVPEQAPADQPAQGSVSENPTLVQETPVAPSSANMAPEALPAAATMPTAQTLPETRKAAEIPSAPERAPAAEQPAQRPENPTLAALSSANMAPEAIPNNATARTLPEAQKAAEIPSPREQPAQGTVATLTQECPVDPSSADMAPEALPTAATMPGSPTAQNLPETQKATEIPSAPEQAPAAEQPAQRPENPTLVAPSANMTPEAIPSTLVQECPVDPSSADMAPEALPTAATMPGSPTAQTLPETQKAAEIPSAPEQAPAAKQPAQRPENPTLVAPSSANMAPEAIPNNATARTLPEAHVSTLMQECPSSANMAPEALPAAATVPTAQTLPETQKATEIPSAPEQAPAAKQPAQRPENPTLAAPSSAGAIPNNATVWTLPEAHVSTLVQECPVDPSSANMAPETLPTAATMPGSPTAQTMPETQKATEIPSALEQARQPAQRPENPNLVASSSANMAPEAIPDNATLTTRTLPDAQKATEIPSAHEQPALGTLSENLTLVQESPVPEAPPDTALPHAAMMPGSPITRRAEETTAIPNPSTPDSLFERGPWTPEHNPDQQSETHVKIEHDSPQPLSPSPFDIEDIAKEPALGKTNANVACEVLSAAAAPAAPIQDMCPSDTAQPQQDKPKSKAAVKFAAKNAAKKAAKAKAKAKEKGTVTPKASSQKLAKDGAGSGTYGANLPPAESSGAASSSDKPPEAPTDEGSIVAYSVGSTFGKTAVARSQKHKFESCELALQSIVLKKFRMALEPGFAKEYLAFCGLGIVKQYKIDRKNLKGLIMGKFSDHQRMWKHAEQRLHGGVGMIILCENHELSIAEVSWCTCVCFSF